MIFVTVLSMVAFIFSSSGDAWSQRGRKRGREPLFTAQIWKKNRPEAKDLQAKDFLNNRFVAELEKEGFLAKVCGGK
jgi:hypothetical protein